MQKVKLGNSLVLASSGLHSEDTDAIAFYTHYSLDYGSYNNRCNKPLP